MSNGTVRAAAEAPQPRVQAWFAPRIWLGCNFWGWTRLLARNGFQVSLSKWHIALSQWVYGVMNSALALAQRARYGRAIAQTTFHQPPIFILGHWRTGTTLLHELLILDPRHGFPTTFECLSPNHFLLSEGLFSRWFSFLVPAQRPMDNMALGFDRPQEEEFAFCNLGMATPYLTVAFPNRPPQYPEYLDFEGVSPEARLRWQRKFRWFLQAVTLRNPKRMVLKSPPHTARLPVLLEMFPDARFVHIVRDPHVVFSSTVHLWRSLYTTHGLQVPTCEGLEEYVLTTLERMYRSFERHRHLIPPGHLFELRYEELVQDPVGQMRALYEQLELGDFEAARPAIERYLAQNKDYQTNRYRLSPEQRAKIHARWGDYLRRNGYATEPAEV